MERSNHGPTSEPSVRVSKGLPSNSEWIVFMQIIQKATMLQARVGKKRGESVTYAARAVAGMVTRSSRNSRTGRASRFATGIPVDHQHLRRHSQSGGFERKREE